MEGFKVAQLRGRVMKAHPTPKHKPGLQPSASSLFHHLGHPFRRKTQL